MPRMVRIARKVRIVEIVEVSSQNARSLRFFCTYILKAVVRLKINSVIVQAK